MADLLLIEPKTTRQVFLGEPVEEVLAMAEWVLKHEGEAEFDPERILSAWAKKRGRGYWRTEDRRVEADEWQEEREGMKCPRCKGSRIALKALTLLSEGEVGSLMAPFPWAV